MEHFQERTDIQTRLTLIPLILLYEVKCEREKRNMICSSTGVKSPSYARRNYHSFYDIQIF